METTVQEGRPEAGPERDLDLLIEKGFLLLGSIEFQIDEHLMSHGTRIAPETRLFMAQVRDAAGDAATKMLDEARTRIEAAPAETPASADAGTGDRAGAAGSMLPAMREVRDARGPARGRRGIVLGRAAARIGSGTAAAALVAALLVSGPVTSDLPADAAGGAPQAAGASGLAAAAEGGGESAGSAAGPAETSIHADAGRGKAKSSDKLLKPVASDPVQAEARTSYPYFTAAPAIAAPRAADRPLSEALAAYAVRPEQAVEQPPYPDPRAGSMRSATDPAVQHAARAEASLDLSQRDRREVQRRLALARFDPRSVDGIFGPATRSALGDWQMASGLPATGYLDAAALAMLRDQTAGAYRALQAAEETHARRVNRTVLASPLPATSPLRADGCSRTRSGKILYGRGVRCDFRGLKQSIARLLG